MSCNAITGCVLSAKAGCAAIGWATTAASPDSLSLILL